MKKSIAIILTVMLLCAMTVSVSAAGVEFKAANGTAVVDAVKDDAYSVCTPIEVLANGSDTSKATVYALWDDQALYFFAEVTTAALTDASLYDTYITEFYNIDSVEAYLDFSGTVTSDGSEDILNIYAGQYTAAYLGDGKTWCGRGGHWDEVIADATYANAATATGYVSEMRIPVGSYKPAANEVIGFIFAINDDADGAGTREYQVMTSTDQGNCWSTVDSLWDRLKFTADKYVEPAPEPEPEVVAEPEAVAEPAVEAAPVVTVAAQTADALSLVALIGILSFAGVAVCKKR